MAAFLSVKSRCQCYNEGIRCTCMRCNSNPRHSNIRLVDNHISSWTAEWEDLIQRLRGISSFYEVLSDHLTIHNRHRSDSSICDCSSEARVIDNNVELLEWSEGSIDCMHNRSSKTHSKRANFGVLIRLDTYCLRVGWNCRDWGCDTSPRIGLSDGVVTVRHLQVNGRRQVDDLGRLIDEVSRVCNNGTSWIVDSSDRASNSNFDLVPYRIGARLDSLGDCEGPDSNVMVVYWRYSKGIRWWIKRNKLRKLRPTLNHWGKGKSLDTIWQNIIATSNCRRC